MKKVLHMRMSILITLSSSVAGAAPAGPNAALPKRKTGRYMTCVRSCLDNLLEHGTDRYGPVHTPMLMSIIDVRTNAQNWSINFFRYVSR